MYEELIKRLEQSESILENEMFAASGVVMSAISEAINELKQIDKMICPPAEGSITSNAAMYLATLAMKNSADSNYNETVRKVALQIQIASDLGRMVGGQSSKPISAEETQAKLQAGMERAKQSLAANNQKLP